MLNLRLKPLFIRTAWYFLYVMLCLWFGSIIFFYLSDLSILKAKPWSLFQLPLSQLKNEYFFNAIIAVFLCAGQIILPIVRLATSNNQPLYGSSRWMTCFEAKKCNLLGKEGLIVGKKWGKFIRIPGWEHIICFAPSGTGKTVSITIPNLLTWKESCVCTDIKLELYQKTAQIREQHGHKCYLWNPGAQDSKTSRYNPLALVGTDKKIRIDELHKIASILIPHNGKTDPIWINGPRNLFIGLTLYVLDNPDCPNTLGEVARTLKRDENFEAFLHEICEDESLDSICKMNLNAFLSTPEVTRGGIKAALESFMTLFENPIIDYATSACDFDIRNLRKELMTVYVGVTNDNLQRLAPLMNIFFQQVMDVMTRKEPNLEQEPHGLLFLLDEFTALREMELFKVNIGLLRSYRVRLLMIVQDLTQLYDTYGRYGGKAFLNVKVRVALTQTSLEDAEYISSLIGSKTVKIASKSIRGLGLSQGENSQSISDNKRPLMLAQEILKLPVEKNIIMIQGLNPIFSEKVIWYKEFS